MPVVSLIYCGVFSYADFTFLPSTINIMNLKATLRAAHCNTDALLKIVADVYDKFKTEFMPVRLDLRNIIYISWALLERKATFGTKEASSSAVSTTIAVQIYRECRHRHHTHRCILIRHCRLHPTPRLSSTQTPHPHPHPHTATPRTHTPPHRAPPHRTPASTTGRNDSAVESD